MPFVYEMDYKVLNEKKKTLGVCHFSKKKKNMFPCCNAQTIISPGFIKN